MDTPLKNKRLSGACKTIIAHNIKFYNNLFNLPSFENYPQLRPGKNPFLQDVDTQTMTAKTKDAVATQGSW